MGHISKAEYETVSVTCDHCQNECVFNRREDFDHPGPYGGEKVNCPYCQREFWMNGDRLQEPYDAFVVSAREHFNGKHYMQTITNLGQAWEVFFAASIRSRYLYAPFFAVPEKYRNPDGLDRLNSLAASLDGKLGFTDFRKLRVVLVKSVLGNVAPATLDDADAAIAKITMEKTNRKADQSMLVSYPGDPHIEQVLKGMMDLRVGDLRNAVLHRRAYRPLRVEAEDCLKEVALLYQAKYRLNVGTFEEWDAGMCRG